MKNKEVTLISIVDVIEMLMIALGLSMDAFAVAACVGLAMPKFSLKKAMIVGAYFGLFQALMPLIGYLATSFFADFVDKDKIDQYASWVAFVVLVLLGAEMIIGSFKKDGKDTEGKATSMHPAHMLPLAIATSIDALAVGVSFAFMNVDIVPAVVLIGLTTFALSVAGVKVGNAFGLKLKTKAEFIGGAILVLMGVKILLEDLGVINF
jgi:putative Mn2+ efflux pump MntP